MRLREVSRLAVGCLLSTSPLVAQTDYPLTADSERHPGVPAGVVTQHSWTSTIFPGTVRDYWVYVPAQYKPEVPAAVMVFQDGGGFVGEQGRWRVPVVFDNLIQKAQMPLTIGIFINPGVLQAPSADQEARYNRSFEYDGLGDRYARFLLEEILPEVAKTHNLTSDPNLRAIAGSSSGGIAAFTVAWNRPDAFRRVLSFIDGSLLHGQPFYRLEVPDEFSDSAADGMTVDREGYLYVATRSGLQVCDQPGRVAAIINKPQPSALSNVVFGGPDLDTLYATAGDKVFRRVVRRRGVFPWQPVKPPPPRL